MASVLKPEDVVHPVETRGPVEGPERRPHGPAREDRAVLGVMALLLLWRHRENIGRLAQGKESRLGSKKK